MALRAHRLALWTTPRAMARCLCTGQTAPVKHPESYMANLSRRLPSGRIITIDSIDGAMFNGCTPGIAHINMDNSDNRAENLRWVNLKQAEELLMSSTEE